MVKESWIIFVLLLFGGFAHGQVDWDASFVARHCGGTVVSEGSEVERVKQIAKLLDYGDLAVQTYVIERDVINAWVVPADENHSLVCIPRGLVRWLTDADGELAFIIAHELGHTMDDSCSSIAGRATIAEKSKSPLTLLFGPSKGDEPGDQRKCEQRADLRAFMLMAKADIDTKYAISALKRLKAAANDKRSGVLGRIFAINDTHPIAADRIKQMQRLQKSILGKVTTD